MKLILPYFAPFFAALSLVACGDAKTEGGADAAPDATATTDDANNDATGATDASAEDATPDVAGDATTTTDGGGNDGTAADVSDDTVTPECDGPEDCVGLFIVPPNLCRVPACIEGICGLGDRDCADADPCTVDACEPSSGECRHQTLDVMAGASRFRLCPGPLAQGDAANACLAVGEDLASFDTIDIADTVTAFIASTGFMNPWVHSVAGETCSSGKAKIVQPQCRVWLDDGTATCATVAPCDELHPFVCERTCDDGDPCTTDGMNADGSCTHDAVSCDDGSVCTKDLCEPFVGCVFNPSIDCADADPCTTDTCLPSDGTCSHKPVRAVWEAGHYEILECPGSAAWADARQRCALDGGVLAQAVTPAQQAALAALAARPGATSSLWAPLFQQGGDPNPWLWMDAGGTGTVPWCTGQPDDTSSIQDCGEWSTLEGCMYDAACTELRSFACVIDITIP